MFFQYFVCFYFCLFAALSWRIMIFRPLSLFHTHVYWILMWTTIFNLWKENNKLYRCHIGANVNRLSASSVRSSPLLPTRVLESVLPLPTLCWISISFIPLTFRVDQSSDGWWKYDSGRTVFPWCRVHSFGRTSQFPLEKKVNET